MEAGSQREQAGNFHDMNLDDLRLDGSELILNQDKIDSRIFYRIEKKIMDRLISALALVILSPLLLLVSVIIKLDDHGPVLYVQKRIGRNGKTFNMYKFRSMIVNADKKIDKLAKKNEAEGSMFKIRKDPRVTRVGRVLRKYSIDELPQLINVLHGDMALVGPRPPLEREVQSYSMYDFQRLMVTPGCSGLWQVTKRNSVGFHEMVDIDIEYIQKSGILFDFGIMIRTIWVMLKPNDAY